MCVLIAPMRYFNPLINCQIKQITHITDHIPYLQDTFIGAKVQLIISRILPYCLGDYCHRPSPHSGLRVFLKEPIL